MNKKPTSLAALIPSPGKIDQLLALPKITVKDVEGLTKAEREIFQQRLSEILSHLKGAERDSFLAKIDMILPDSTKNSVWEHNHMVICKAIADYMQQYGVMPAKNAIAETTGLSRQTVAKHFKEYRSHPEFLMEMEQFKFMSHKVLAQVFKYASNGDMKAARLYFEMVGSLTKHQTRTVLNEQNNYIQINNTILSQENLNRLSTEQLKQIENIVSEH